MKAVVARRFGGPDVLELADVALPELNSGQALVRMAWAGVNFTDIYRREGLYAHSPTYPTTLPLIPGVEGSGVVHALGEGVASVRVGDRVAFTRGAASYAQYCAVAAHRLVKVPEGLGLDVAASVLSQGLTAHYLAGEYGLARGMSCLVHAGAGGVGQFLIQVAKMKGARVLATAGSPQKARIARERGADEVILYREVSFRAEVARITDGAGVDIVFDSIGKDTLIDSLHCLRRKGLCVLYGHSSGLVKNFEPMELAEAGSVLLTRPHMEHFVQTPEAYAARAREVMQWVHSGAVKVTIDRRFALDAAGDAQRALAARQSHGKFLIEIDGAV